MSTLYLIDPFVPPGAIVDVTAAPTGELNCTGSLVVRVPDGVAIRGAPRDLPSLLQAKLVGTLGLYAGFANVAGDACFDGTGVSWVYAAPVAQSDGLSTGSGFSPMCIGALGSLSTKAVALASTPTQCVVVWETFTFVNDDPINGRFTRVYLETPPSALTGYITFGGGSAMSMVTSGVVMNIDPADQGSTATLRFVNPGQSRVYFGGWSLIY